MNSTNIRQCAYNANLRRVRKDWGSNDYDFLYDGWRAIEIRKTATQLPYFQSIFGNYLDEQIEADYNGGTPDATCTGAGDAAYGIQNNALFSVYAVTRPDKTINSAFEYDPYGYPTRLIDGNDGDTTVNFNSNDTRAAGIGSTFLHSYTGQIYDYESGLYYYNYRYYHPGLGRFASHDPIGYLGGPNRYAYVFGNPLRFLDPLGLQGLSDEDYIKYAIQEKQKLPKAIQKAKNELGAFAYTMGAFQDTAEMVGGMLAEPLDWYTGARDAIRAWREGHPKTAVAIGLAAAIPFLPGKAGKTACEAAAEVGTDLTRFPGKVEIPAGQIHHPISNPVQKAAERHPNLAGEYKPRDPRFTTQAIDETAHKGYQTWHRDLDKEVKDWLEQNGDATSAEFEAWLRWRYSQPDLRARFPDGI